ncbi:hypothetical protein Ct61P_04355 [Colletotrichum tofieldiae]|nr:hypothetical protein Ct61P_04355 [Colletotrichum tofieldiae]
MLPPVEASVLQNNPEFAALHHALTTAILNPDGSTKKPATKEQTSIQNLGDLVSTTLHTSAVSLARIANPTTNPSFLHRNVPALQTTYHKLETEVREAKHALARERLCVAGSLTGVLDKHASALTLLIRALEAKHGVVARSLEFRAAETGLEAQRAEADAVAAREGVRREVYSPEMVAALNNYAAHLRDARMRLESTVMTLRAELEGYGVGMEGDEGKERMMREMARKKRQLERELEDANRDLARLDKA